MTKAFTVSMADIIEENMLETVYMPAHPENLMVACSDVNRPGLAIGGYFDYFDKDRIQIMGKSEHGYLADLSQETRKKRIDEFISRTPPAVVVTRGLEILPELRESCERYQVALLSTKEATSSFMATLIAYLNVELAPRITRHGVFVEVYGEGVLLVLSLIHI